MSVNGITSGVSNSYPSTSFSRETASKTETKKTADTGVVYAVSYTHLTLPTICSV